MKPPELEARLWHVVRACERIGRYTNGKTPDDYSEDDQLRDAVERQFITLGEALRAALAIDESLRSRLPNAARVIGFRNQLVHNYPHIEDEVVWQIIISDLPRLHADVRALLG